MPPASISQLLGAHLVREKEAHDLSRNPEFAAFQFIGLRTSPLAVELVAFCDADGLNEREIVRLRDEFFAVLRHRPREFGVRTRGRNPNGLLGFVFADGCSEQMARFVARQTRIDHGAGTGGVSVAWAIDARNRRIHTHDNPVSVFPPVVVLARSVYPGLEYLQSLLDGMPAPQPLRKKTFEEFTHGILQRQSTPDAAPAPSIETPGPDQPERIRILFVAVDSLEVPLDLGWELRGIQANLRAARERERLDLKSLMAATMDSLTQAMLDDSPTIIHFSGHGEHEGLVLRDEGGGKHIVSGESLARLFALFSESVQCVILNACSSEEHAQAIHRHVPYVIGVRAPLPDPTAIAFSSGFYMAIGAGRDVPFAYKLGIARAEADGAGGADLITLF